MFDTVSNLARLWHAARMLSRHDALMPKEMRDRLPPSARAARIVLGLGQIRSNAPPGIRLALALERLGPAYIKLGQMLATRPDIVGEDVAVALEHLQDRLPPFPNDVARAAIEKGLGRPISEMFLSLDPPIAAASIAQVHPAVTSGESAAPGHRENLPARPGQFGAVRAHRGTLVYGSAPVAFHGAGADPGRQRGAGA